MHRDCSNGEFNHRLLDYSGISIRFNCVLSDLQKCKIAVHHSHIYFIVCNYRFGDISSRYAVHTRRSYQRRMVLFRVRLPVSRLCYLGTRHFHCPYHDSDRFWQIYGQFTPKSILDILQTKAHLFCPCRFLAFFLRNSIILYLGSQRLCFSPRLWRL